MPLRLHFLPVLVTNGPLFVVIAVMVPICKMGGWQGLLALLLAIGGAFMTSAALIIMSREIVRLRQLIEPETEGHVPS